MKKDIEIKREDNLLLEMLFNQSPHAIILADLSQVKQALMTLTLEKGKESLTINKTSPSKLEEIASKIKVIKVNKHVLDFFPKFNKQETNQFWTAEMDLIKALFIDICKNDFGWKDFKDSFIKYSIDPLPGYEQSLKTVLITLSKKNQNQTAIPTLRDSNKNYQQLFEEAPISLWEEDFSKVHIFFNELRKKGVTDFRGHFDQHPEDIQTCLKLIEILDVNQATLDLYKATSKEMLLGGLDKIITESSLQSLKEELVQLEAGNKHVKINTEAIDFNNDIHYLEAYLSVLSTENENPLSRVLVSTIDITTQKIVEQELQESKINLTEMRDNLAQIVVDRIKDLQQQKIGIETIVEFIPQGILVCGADKHLFLANRSFRQLYKRITKEEFTKNFTISQAMQNPRLANNKLISEISRMVNNVNLNYSKIEPLPGVHIELQSQIIKAPEDYKSKTNSNNLGVIIQTSDISSFVEFESVRQQFISMVSHELRTPITAINLGINNLIKYKNTLKESQTKNLLESIARNSKTLSEIIEDLLVVSKIDSNNIEIILKPTNLYEVVKKSLLLLQPKLNAKNIKYAIIMDKGIKGNIDEKRIGQVMRILIDNAIKFSKNNSTITIEGVNNYQGELNPGQAEGALIKVKDSGIGIKEEDKSKIFNRFFRGTNTENIQGTGLGLSIARNLIALHGGNMSFTSEENKGSTFMFFIPCFQKKNKKKWYHF